MTPVILPYPDNKRLAFTFTDDADDSTTGSVKTMYEFLDSMGMKVTKTVWVLPATRRSGNPEQTGKQCNGATLSDPDHLTLVRDIQARGHEIALHLASGGNNLRQETITAYEIFKNQLGNYPRLNVNHGRNADTIYWCREMMGSGLIRALTSLYCRDRSEGHVEGSPYFWGDMARRHTQYFRRFKTLCFDTLRINPSAPYHDPGMPLVNRWFSATDLSEPWLIERAITPWNISRAIRRNGGCIGYTYLHRFALENGRIDVVFVRAMELLQREAKRCWFIPVSTLLDRLECMQKVCIRTAGNENYVMNSNTVAVNDVWISGEPGTAVRIDGLAPVTIGASGVAQIAQIPPLGGKGDRQTATLPRLRNGEKVRMVVHQLGVLAVRHLHGRALQTQGWR